MIGVFLLTHGTLGESLIQSCCHVLNRRPAQITQLGVSSQDDPFDLLPLARELCTSVDQGRGVIVLTDIFGATPANLAMKLMVAGRVEGIAGVNLPMLLRILTYRDKSDIQTVVQKAIAGACDGALQMR